jgi:hypothetical protein
MAAGVPYFSDGSDTSPSSTRAVSNPGSKRTERTTVLMRSPAPARSSSAMPPRMSSCHSHCQLSTAAAPGDSHARRGVSASAA